MDQIAQGISPFGLWLQQLGHARLRAWIEVRLKRIGTGPLGDWRAVGQGVIEFCLDLGSGYRVYAGRHGARCESHVAPSHRTCQALLGGLEAEADMNNRHPDISSIFHGDETIAELRAVASGKFDTQTLLAVLHAVDMRPSVMPAGAVTKI